MARQILYAAVYLVGMVFWWLVFRFLLEPRVPIPPRTLWEFYAVMAAVLAAGQWAMYFSGRIQSYRVRLRFRLWVTGVGASVLLACVTGWLVLTERSGNATPIILMFLLSEGIVIVAHVTAYRLERRWHIAAGQINSK